MVKIELCYPEDNCLTEDTIIVVLYGVFCICFGFIVALLVIWADKRKSKTISITNTHPGNGNVEVNKSFEEILFKLHTNVQVAQSQVKMTEERDLEEVYRSVTRLEEEHRKMSSQFSVDRGLGNEESN